jgi:acyl CoA:acetate/3-ketoacid CoA transferase beta subunit
VVTDLGILTRRDGELMLTHLAPGVDVEHVQSRCGWDLAVADDLAELPAVSDDDVKQLRKYDREGLFLGKGNT